MNDYIPTTGEIRLLMQSSNIAFEVPPEGFDRWLAEHDRQVAERVWDETYSVALSDISENAGVTYNPYRQGEEQ